MNKDYTVEELELEIKILERVYNEINKTLEILQKDGAERCIFVLALALDTIGNKQDQYIKLIGEKNGTKQS